MSGQYSQKKSEGFGWWKRTPKLDKDKKQVMDDRGQPRYHFKGSVTIGHIEYWVTMDKWAPGSVGRDGKPRKSHGYIALDDKNAKADDAPF